MSLKILSDALTSVDWADNVAQFLGLPDNPKKLDRASLRLAIWARQFEDVEKGNPALCFTREMQVNSFHVAMEISLGLYKPAAASMRAMVENALYYSFFRTHPSELVTLIRDKNYFLTKEAIIEYHKRHTPNFAPYQNRFGLLSKLDGWYGLVSSLIHGQVPGVWGSQKSISDTKYDPATAATVTDTFIQGEEIVHYFFLSALADTMWSDISSAAKKQLIAGLHGDVKAALKLDSG
jgi:hypothetical protein